MMTFKQFLTEEDNSMLFTMIKLLMNKGIPIRFNFKLRDYDDGEGQYPTYSGLVFMYKGGAVFARDTEGVEERVFLNNREADESLELKKVGDGYEVVNAKK